MSRYVVYILASHNSKTHPSDIELYKERAKNVDLTWCSQVISLLEKYYLNFEKISINDIGCNYGQLYKEIKRRNLQDKYDYFGYDHDNNFMEIGKKSFPEIRDKFIKLDIEKYTPKISDISICSATFEHLDNPFSSLKNILSTTSQLMILRTFVGSENIDYVQNDKKIVKNPYNINQFNLFDLSEIFFEYNFDFCCLKDEATKSQIYEVGKSSGVFRQFYIVVGNKLKKLNNGDL